MKLAVVYRLVRVGVALHAVLALLVLPLDSMAEKSKNEDASTPAGWQVYTDIEWGYSVRYPDDWQPELTFFNNASAPDYVIRKQVTFSNSGAGQININAWQKQATLGVIEWVRKVQGEFLDLGGVAIPDSPNARIAGVDALVLTQPQSCTGPALVLAYVSTPDRVISIEYPAFDNGNALDVYQSMLASFAVSTAGITAATETQLPSLAASLFNECPDACCYAPVNEGCCGISRVADMGNWQCSEDKATRNIHKGNCTWWAAHQRPDVGQVVTGHAGQWASSALQRGFPVDQTPRVGDIMVDESLGHVAYVTTINGNQVSVTEMNWCSSGTCLQTNFWPTTGKKFIHPKLVTLYENPLRGGREQSYGIAGTQSLPSWGPSSITFGKEPLAVILRPKWWWFPWQPAPCIVLDRNVDDFRELRYSDLLTTVNDNIGSLELFDMQCPSACSYYPFASSVATASTQSSIQGLCSGSSRCPAPGQVTPENGYVSQSRTVTFDWKSVSCSHNGYTLRVKTVPNMDSGGETVISVSEDDTDRTVTFDSRWDERDLYWSVRAASAPGGASWAPARQFRISPNRPPSISFDTANGNTFSSGRIESREQDWTFLGTASDPEGQLSRVEFRCSGDNCGAQAVHTGTSNWSRSQTGMSGQNDIYFIAYDDRQSTKSRHLDLRIDLAPPRTTASLNGDADPARWPAWFTSPVTVRLQAEDGSTGRARAGVQEVRYRVDGGGWQTHTGSDISFAITADGAHAVEYYALDKVGNQEASQTISFNLDQVPPTPPGATSETHGTTSGVWQRATNTPTFAWDAATDATSGVWGYQFYFGPDPNGEAYQTFTAGDPREWTPQPAGVRTGTYYLRGRTRDNAGNWSPWTSLFTFRYDGAPPENPSRVTHAASVANDTWQRTTGVADFTWPVPHDEGSGIKGYNVYWGSDPAGTSADFITANRYAAGALCRPDHACAGYLRLRSQDNVDNLAQDWTTAFVLRYDGAPPTADFTFSGGITQTQQTLITLNLAATDEGSGVKLMQFSGDGENWTPWEVYAPQRQWQIPAISRQWWPVYLRVQDGVGLESAVISHAVYLEVNPDQPRSNNYRLFDHILSAGAGAYNSVGYQGRGTLGQTLDAGRSNSSQYTLVGGYEAGSQALPIVRPGHDEFNFVNGIFASGVVAETLSSATFQMIGTVGELGLPNNQTTLNSGNYQHQPGFLAARPSSAVATPTPTPTPGPTPTPTPVPACAEPRVRINGGAAFTSHPSVELDICSPNAVEMMVSNSEDFAGAQWEPYASAKAWTLPTAGQQVLPRFVYVAFKSSAGVVSSTHFDDIIYDPNAPVGAVSVGDSIPGSALAAAAGQANAVTTAYRAGKVVYLTPSEATPLAQPLAVLAPSAEGAVDLYINAMDDNSGMAEMQISDDADFADATWEPFSALRPFTPAGGDGVKTVYARFRDEASNVSASVQTSFMLDTEAPYGGIALERRVVGPDVITTAVYLGAEDNLSGVTDVRLSLDPGFGDAAWQPYTSTVTWPISLTVESARTLYGQYRDLAGNVSAVYTDTYAVDLIPPQVYVEVEPAETLTRTVHVYAYDELSALDVMTLSNDPLMADGIVTMPYTDTVTWSFDERRVVWVQLSDSVGNITEPYPAYADEVLAPMAVTVAISQDSAYTTLTWQHLSSNRQYEVWRSTIPYLDPDEPDANLERLAVLDPPVEGTAMMYQDVNGPYYYLVRSLNALGAYADSIRVGRFEFRLVPGGG